MTTENFAMWYALLGVAAVLTWIVRFIKGKIVVEPDEMTVLAIFLFPWMYFGLLGFKFISKLFTWTK